MADQRASTTSNAAALDTSDEDFDFFYDYAKAAQLRAEGRSEGWTEENWETEMEKHPLFISSNPQPNSAPSPLVDALTQLKYDPEFNSPLELMESYKADGNENFRIKKYRWAADNYSEGVRIARRELSKTDTAPIALEDKVKIIKLVATLYNNRASANFFLENYRSSARDAKLAYSLDPTHQKAILRVSKCLQALGKFSDLIDYCQSQLSAESRAKPDAATVAELRQTLKSATTSLKLQERDQRKAAAAEERRMTARQEIENAVTRRGIVYRGSLFETDHGAAVHGHLVHFSDEEPEAGFERPLIWPVIFVFPETGQSDFIEAFHESTTFLEMFKVMFASPAEWDREGAYVPERLRLWYHSYEDERYSGLILKELVPTSTIDLLSAMRAPGFIVTNAIPTFVVTLEEPRG